MMADVEETFTVLANFSVNMTDNNITDITTCWSVPRCKITLLTLDILTIVISFIGTLGNILAFVVLYKQTSWTSNTVLLQMLSAADGALMLTIFIFKSNLVLKTTLSLHEHLGVEQSVLASIFDVCQYTSIWILVYMAVDRYIAIRFPLMANRWCKVSTTYKVLPVIILGSIAISMPRMVQLAQGNHYHLDRAYNIVSTVLRYFLPVIILIILNTHLIITIYRATTDIQSSLSQQRSTISRNVTVNLIVVVLIFLVCGTYKGITWILDMSFQSVFPDHFTQIVTRAIGDILMITNSAINFFVYSFCYKRFRETLCAMICNEDSSEQTRNTSRSTKYHTVVSHAKGNERTVLDKRASKI